MTKRFTRFHAKKCSNHVNNLNKKIYFLVCKKPNLIYHPDLLMDSPDNPVSADIPREPGTCPSCGSASRVGRSLCLSCLLTAGVDANRRNDDASAVASAKAETL